MSLVVDRIKCLEESDEQGSDDIYLIVFRGRTAAPFGSELKVVGPGSPWSDFDSGEARSSDVKTVGTSADSVYAVMMVEKDNARDISGPEVIGAWTAQTDLVWKSIMLGLAAAGTPTGSEPARAGAFIGIRSALNGLASIYMEFPKGNDDVIRVRRATITSVGQSQTLRFRSNEEDATYDVTFKQTAAA